MQLLKSWESNLNTKKRAKKIKAPFPSDLRGISTCGQNNYIYCERNVLCQSSVWFRPCGGFGVRADCPRRDSNPVFWFSWLKSWRMSLHSKQEEEARRFLETHIGNPTARHADNRWFARGERMHALQGGLHKHAFPAPTQNSKKNRRYSGNKFSRDPSDNPPDTWVAGGRTVPSHWAEWFGPFCRRSGGARAARSCSEPGSRPGSRRSPASWTSSPPKLRLKTVPTPCRAAVTSRSHWNALALRPHAASDIRSGLSK